MKRTGRVRPRSEKRIAQDRERTRQRREAAERGRLVCEAADRLPFMRCAGPIDHHEVLTRARGGSPIDPANRLYVCRAMHEWITVHPLEAAELGLVLPSRR